MIPSLSLDTPDTPAERYRARGALTFKGRVEALGRLYGPNTFGQVFVATEAVYDEVTDTTRVTCHTACQADLDNMVVEAPGIVRVGP